MIRGMYFAILAVTAWGQMAQASDKGLKRYMLAEIAGIDKPIILFDSIIHQARPSLGIYADAIEHCFDRQELPSMLKQGKAKVIIHHGLPVNAKGYVEVYSHTETLPFFVNKKSGVETLTAHQATQILSGTIRNWKQVGGLDKKIRIFGPAANLNRRGLRTIVREANRKTIKIEFSNVGNYKTLADAVNETEGGLSIGLRSIFAQGNRIPNVTRVFPVNKKGELVYSVPIFLYVKKQDETARKASLTLLQGVAKRALNDGHKYPLKERLEVFRKLYK